MNYTIVHDMPGRIRLRCGRCAFTDRQGLGIEQVLMQQSFVKEVRASSINGSLLIFYEIDKRHIVLNCIDHLSIDNLPDVPQNSYSAVSLLDADFQFALIKKIVRQLFLRLLVPMPIRHVITIARAIPYLFNGAKSLSHAKLGVDVLDAASIGISLAQYNFKTAGSIMFLLSISDLLEDYTRKKTKMALSQSLSINVDTVWKLNDNGQEISVPLANVQPGDHLALRTSATIPVDGTILSGEAFINQACMTGESQSVLKKAEDTVFAGTVIEDGSIVVEVRALGDGTRMNKIIDLIDQSEALKAGVQSRAEKLADSIVPFSFLASGLVYLFTRNMTKAASVLLVDYSCALKLSTPIAVISAMREASSRKVVVKGGKYLEAFAEADTIVFDKTGTLTAATPTVTEVIPFDGYERDEVLRIAACLEEHFPHSVARAIVRQAEIENLKHREEHAEVEYIVAHGIKSRLHGEQALIGSWHFIVEDEGIIVTEAQKQVIHEKGRSKSTIFLALGTQLAGMLCIDDPIRPEAASVIASLKNMGIKDVVMLTGDADEAAKSVAKQLGITAYRAQILPEDKAAIIESLKSEGRKVIMVGDGINDSPALAAADVSVSMKDSSDIAREVSDITLLSAELTELATLRRLSTALMQRIRHNYAFILVFNTSLLVGGVIGVLPAAASALLHNVSTMAISAASMRPCLKEKNGEQ